MAVYRSPLTVTLWPSSFLKKYGSMIPPAHKAHQTHEITTIVQHLQYRIWDGGSLREPYCQKSFTKGTEDAAVRMRTGWRSRCKIRGAAKCYPISDSGRRETGSYSSADGDRLPGEMCL
ncbi:hypothetical protein TNCV_5010741 [Trichonephila clavipes]|nr:hypothetical protein TNCV_5010741 [Trichonephila clavipes]